MPPQAQQDRDTVLPLESISPNSSQSFVGSMPKAAPWFEESGRFEIVVDHSEWPFKSSYVDVAKSDVLPTFQSGS